MHAELQAYAAAMLDAMVLGSSAAAKRQHRATASELGLLPLDDLADTESIPARIAYLNELMDEVPVGPCLPGSLACWCQMDRADRCLLGFFQRALPSLPLPPRGWPPRSSCACAWLPPSQRMCVLCGESCCRGCSTTQHWGPPTST